MLRHLPLLLVVATHTSASAQPTPTAPSESPGYVGIGGAVVAAEGPGTAGVVVEGGLRLGAMPVFARGMLEAGAAATVFEDGSYRAGRVGLELRHRWLFLGVDAGVRTIRLDYTDDAGMTTTTRDREALIAPRAGIDVGRARLRGRFAVELSTGIADGDVRPGVGLTAAAGYAF